MKRLILFLCLIAMAGSLFAQPKGYQTYWNEKNEYSILIPDAYKFDLHG